MLANNRPIPDPTTSRLRPWRRLHASSFVVLIGLAAIVSLANVPGDRNWQGTECRHGWPATYLIRSIPFAKPDGIRVWSFSRFGADVDPGIRSLFEDEFVSRFDPLWLIVDVLVGLLVVALGTAAFEFWRRRRARVWQFGLAELLVIVSLTAAAFGWWQAAERRYRTQSPAVADIEKLGARVEVERGAPDWLSDLAKRARSETSSLDPGQSVPDWLSSRRPESRLDIHSPGIERNAPQLLTDPASLELLRTFDEPVSVVLGPGPSNCGVWVFPFMIQNEKIGDAELAPLGKLTTLKVLDLTFTQHSDDGLKHFESLDRLEELSLVCTKVTNAGMVHLKGKKKLRWLDLRGTGVTEDGIRSIREALPKCKIVADDP